MAAYGWILLSLLLLGAQGVLHPRGSRNAPGRADLGDLEQNNCRTEPRDSDCAGTCGLSECYDTSSQEGTSYPSGGMCSVRNVTHTSPPDLTSYVASATVCQYAIDYPQGTGIGFNWQDAQNYDVFYKRDLLSDTCEYGYVEADAVVEVGTFACPPTVEENTHVYRVAVDSDNLVLMTLELQDGTTASGGPFPANFALNSQAAVVMVNEGDYEFLEFNTVLIEETVSGPSACASAPCMNGGTCAEDGSGGFTCACPPPFTGTQCETDAGGSCESSPCVNGGTCLTDDDGNAICRCPPKFYGPICQSEVSQLEYEFTMRGSFNSESGLPFPTDCQPQYNNAFVDETEETSQYANTILLTPDRPDVCGTKTNDDIVVGSTAAFLFAPGGGTSGETSSRFIMQCGDDQTFQEVIDCGDELSVALEPFVTWGEPILPGIPGCPNLDFEGNKFNTTITEWRCIDDTGRSLPVRRDSDNEIAMELVIEGSWVTFDGSDLTPQCAIAYDEELTFQAFEALEFTNQQLGVTLCLTAPGMVLTTNTKQFTPSTASNGTIDVQYFASIDVSMPIPDVYQCTREISDFIRQHSNWGDPILDTPPTCPGLVFAGHEFTEVEQRWACTQPDPPRTGARRHAP